MGFLSDLSDAFATNLAGGSEMLGNAWINLFGRKKPENDEHLRRTLVGKVCIVTGGNAGVGLATAQRLAEHGANVVLACRNRERGRAAAQAIKAQLGGHSNSGDVKFEQLDLGQLSSVRSFISRVNPPDLLVCNAGIMAHVPERHETPDRLEEQFQANYLGHWLLAHELLLRPVAQRQQGTQQAMSRESLARPAGNDERRVIFLSSVTHVGGRINFDDLQAQRRYDPLKSYMQSKLAAVIGAYDFQRRFDSLGSPNTAVAVDPGVLDTDLARNFFRGQVPRPLRRLLRPVLDTVLPWMLLPPQTAADSVLWAVTAPAHKVKGRFVKNAKVASASRKAGDRVVADRLWLECCRLTGVEEDFTFSSSS